MRILVTGGTGLVGSHVIHRLRERGHDVHAIVRSAAGERLVQGWGARAVSGAVEHRACWLGLDHFDTIVHAAALVTQQETWERFRHVNVDGTAFAAETAARLGARLVHISSVAVYGRRPRGARGKPITEDAPRTSIAHADYYARSKRLAEETLWAAAERLDLRAVALRPCVVYGERDRAVIPNVVRVLRTGVAPLVGSGENRLAVVYAGNVADAVLQATERPEVRGAFNVTNDGDVTQRAFFLTIAQAMGRRVRFVRLPLAAAVAVGKAFHAVHRLLRPDRYAGVGASGIWFLARDNPYASARAYDALGWTPSTPATDALRRSVEWYLRSGEK